MKTPTLHKSLKSGFSLVELLVVIAVIAVIAAIAIPNIAGITGAANAAKDQRNAQNIVSTFNAAVAAGYANATLTTASAAAGAVTNGITVNIGNTSNFFRVDGLSAGEFSNAILYIETDLTNAQSGRSGTMVYRTTARSVATPSPTP